MIARNTDFTMPRRARRKGRAVDGLVLAQPARGARRWRAGAAARAQVGADRRRRIVRQRHARHRHASCSAPIARATPSNGQVGDHGHFHAAPEGVVAGRSSAHFATGYDRRAATRHAARARRCPACRARCPIRAACSSRSTTRSRRSREPMPGRRADERVGYFSTDARLQRRPEAHARGALRQPLAPREEGPGGRAVRAEEADRVLDRPQHSGQVPRRDPRRHPRVEQGVREDRLQGRDPGRGPARRRRLRHVDVAPRVGTLDDQRSPALRRDRARPRRPAHRRNPRRRHRHRSLSSRS